MARILALDTSATPASCALLQEGRVLARSYAHTSMTHSQTLLPMVDHVLNSGGVTVDQLDALAVNVGPGSFTGVRIGVSTVKGLAFAKDIPCVPVSTLESMAAMFAGLPGEGVLACVMDARCQQVYVALFAWADGQVKRLTPDEAKSIDDLSADLKKCKNSIVFVGDGAELCYTMLKEQLPGACLAPSHLRYQDAVGTACVAARLLAAGETVSSSALLPTYLRLPQAERELRRRQNAEHTKNAE